MRTTLPNARQVPRQAGIATFCRFPRLEDVPAEQQPIDWVVYGIPFDLGVTYRPGARFGPRAIRAESAYIKPVHLEHGINLAERLSIADGGDAPLRPFGWKETLDAARDFALGLGERGHTRLLAVGGDHSIAYANMHAAWERRGKPKGGLAVLHFDAHLDTVDVIDGNRWSHASPFRRAHEDGVINMQRMISIGVRGPLNRLDDLEYSRKSGVQILHADAARTAKGMRQLAAFVKRLRRDPVYLSFDIDCIDPAYAPGTGTPSCGGFTSAEAFALLRACAGVNLVGADVVEVLPDRDVSGITALLAAHVMFETLCLAALGARREDARPNAGRSTRARRHAT